jgi:glucokinase
LTKVIAADIGGTRFRVALFDHAGQPLSRWEGETLGNADSGGRDWMLMQLQKQFDAIRNKIDDTITGCGISFGGPVDFKRQQVSSIHSAGWDKFPLAAWVQGATGIPCRVDNDANAGALGEYRFGAGRATHSMTYVTISTGIGSGVVYEGKVLHGKDGLTGEIGHMPLCDSKAICSCGASGCLEALASGTAIARRARKAAEQDPKASARILQFSGGLPQNITAKAVFQAAGDGDAVASLIVSEAARWVARALVTIIRVLDPDKIVLGGGVTQAGELLLGPVREFLREFGASSIGYSTVIQLAELGAYSPLYGAAALALDMASGDLGNGFSPSVI